MAAVTPQPKVDVDQNYERQIKAMQTQAAAAQPAVSAGGGAQWYMPEKNKWSGDLGDYEGMSSAFNRDQANQQGASALDPKAPGVSGDLVSALTQIEVLSVMERAFRSRHMTSRPRLLAHALGRVAGMGNDKGSLVQCQLAWVRGLINETKKGAGK